jgi:hypothetical protein
MVVICLMLLNDPQSITHMRTLTSSMNKLQSMSTWVSVLSLFTLIYGSVSLCIGLNDRIHGFFAQNVGKATAADGSTG